MTISQKIFNQKLSQKIRIKFAQFHAELFDFLRKAIYMGSYGTKRGVAILLHVSIVKSVINLKNFVLD
jgi:hypothetical protein